LIVAVSGAPADAEIVTPGITVIVVLFDLVVSLTEVAVSVTETLAVNVPLGGVYVAVRLEAGPGVTVPHCVAEQLGGAKVTPDAEGSPLTAAITVKACCPCSICAALAVTESTETWAVTVTAMEYIRVAVMPLESLT
jgi:hypothetical protein